MAVVSSPPLSWGAVEGEGAPWGPLARQSCQGPVLTHHDWTGACYSQSYSTPVLPVCWVPLSSAECVVVAHVCVCVCATFQNDPHEGCVIFKSMCNSGIRKRATSFSFSGDCDPLLRQLDLWPLLATSGYYAVIHCLVWVMNCFILISY